MSQSKTSHLALQFAFLVAFGAPAAAGDADSTGRPEVVLSFHASPELDGERVLISDLADVKGGDGVLNAKIASLDLGYAPRPGMTQAVDAETVRQRVESVFNVRATREGPLKVIALRKSSEPDMKRLWDELRGWLAREWSVGPEDIRGLEMRLPGHIRLPVGRQQFAFRTTGREGEAGCTLTVGDFEKSFVIQTRASVMVVAGVARRDLKFGKKIAIEDVAFEKTLVEGSPWSVVRVPEHLEFATVKAPIPSGKPIRMDALRQMFVVRRGDAVTISLRNDRVALSTQGEALQPGKIGQRIDVKNTASGRVVKGRVVSDREVLVESGRY